MRSREAGVSQATTGPTYVGLEESPDTPSGQAPEETGSRRKPVIGNEEVRTVTSRSESNGRARSQISWSNPAIGRAKQG